MVKKLLSMSSNENLAQMSRTPHLYTIRSILPMQESPNVFVRGTHKLLHSSSMAEHLAYCDCFGKCYVLPNQQVFRETLFFIIDKISSRAG